MSTDAILNQSEPNVILTAHVTKSEPNWTKLNRTANVFGLSKSRTLDVVCTRSDLTTVDCVIECCCGQCHYSVGRRSTPHQHVELGDRSTETSSRPTCRLQASALCDDRRWQLRYGRWRTGSALYDDTITRLLDQQIPAAETKTCRRRPSNAWFDDDKSNGYT